MVEIHLVPWEVISGAAAYGGVFLATSRIAFNKYREQWMDSAIRKRRAWEAGLKPQDTRRSRSPQEMLENVREDWKRKGSSQGSEDAFYAGLLWPVYWAGRIVNSGSRPSREEKLLMDQADYERLRELERQVGLTPLDEEPCDHPLGLGPNGCPGCGGTR